MNLLCCCLIHVCIGSIYAESVLYNSIISITNWERSFLVLGFSITILALGLSACFYRKLCYGSYLKEVIIEAVVLWILSSCFIWLFVFNKSPIIYLTISFIKGIAIGILYASTISIVTEQYSKHRGITNGLVVMSFGIGSLIAANLYSYFISLQSSDFLLIFIMYGVIMVAASLALSSEEIIGYVSLVEVIKEPLWKKLSLVFFLNIGIGITLLSNLVDLSVQNKISLEQAIELVALCGLANGLGRIVWSTISENMGRINTLTFMIFLQLACLITLPFSWEINVIIIISIYGGVFALMPSICSEFLETKAVGYSALLVWWGLAGLIIPNLYMMINSIYLLIIMCGILGGFCLRLRKDLG